MKKYILFAGSFVVAYFVLQVLSGMLLTMFYTPSISKELDVALLQSQVVFGGSSFIGLLVIVLLSLGVAFGVVKLIQGKATY